MKNLEFFQKKYNLGLKPGVDYRVKENHKTPAKLNVEYFVFGRTMYCRNSFISAPFHEYLHIAQFRKYGTFLVIMHYLYNITKNKIKYKDFQKAYDAIPFEVEARRYEDLMTGKG